MNEPGLVHGHDLNPPDWDRVARETAHRPWPLPPQPWRLAQSWSDLLFAHWPVSERMLRPLVPAGLTIDTFGGDAWIGVVPFRLGPIAPRGMLGGRGLAFPELNVRTYVTAGNKPGVWFFSLDAASLPAVLGARAAYHLPYYWARMREWEEAGWIEYRSRRRTSREPVAAFSGRYRPVAPVVWSEPGSLEYFLTERYCLYAANARGRLWRGNIHHAPWPLQAAEAELTVNTAAAAHGIDLTGPPLLHFAHRLDVLTWLPESVRD